MALYSYVITHDNGFAPNPFGTWCSLACCKPRIRAGAQLGDWIIGTTATRDGPGRLLFFMRVEEAITFSEYFHDKRFQSKKPSKKNPHGDNIYSRTGSGFFQIENYHHGPDQMAKDTGTDRVLLGREFYYFGQKAPSIALRLRDTVVYQRRGQRKIEDKVIIDRLVKWVQKGWKPGIHGDPIHDKHPHNPIDSGGVCRSLSPTFANTEMQIILIRVGIDKATGGTLGPLFPNGRFEYVPIPEYQASKDTPTYQQLRARSGGSISRFLPEKLKDAPAHVDPDFENKTYGDPTRNKRRQLLRLRTGGLVVFYAGLQGFETCQHAGLFLIGYLTVENVFDLPVGRLPEIHRSKIRNAHLVRRSPDRGLVIVKGSRAKSRLLGKAIKIAQPSGEPNQTAKGLLGYGLNLQRAIGRWLSPEKAPSVKKFLEEAD